MNDFLEQTAKDYDMSIEEVKNIYENSSNSVTELYKTLELYINNRIST